MPRLSTYSITTRKKNKTLSDDYRKRDEEAAQFCEGVCNDIIAAAYRINFDQLVLTPAFLKRYLTAAPFHSSASQNISMFLSFAKMKRLLLIKSVTYHHVFGRHCKADYFMVRQTFQDRA